MEMGPSDRSDGDTVAEPMRDVIGEPSSRCPCQVNSSDCASRIPPPPGLTVQRILVVDFVGGTYKVAKLFVECITTLPNLHTLEIVSMSGGRIVQSLATALEKRKQEIQQVRTLVLPPAAHWLLRYCPNVEDLTCCDAKPDERFVESLVVGGLNRITRFSVLYPEGRDIWSSRSTSFPSLSVG